MPIDVAIRDWRFRAEHRLRQWFGARAIEIDGARWAAGTANATKTIRLLARADPLKSRFLADVGPDDVLLDVGANFGAWTIPAALRPGGIRQVYAVEPSPAPFVALLENLQLNECADRVVALPLALGSAAGLVPFQIDSPDPTAENSHVAGDREAAHAVTGALWKPAPVRVTVPVFRADDLCERKVIERPTLMKVDVEGFEAEVLAGAGELLHSVRRLFVEIHPDRLVGADSETEILEVLAAAGLEVVERDQRGRQLHVLCERQGTATRLGPRNG